MIPEETISKLIKERRAIIKKEYLNVILSSDYISKTKEIVKLLKKGKGALSVDFIIESLTHLGDAPAILYDDNGLFCVASSGIHPTVFGRQRIVGHMTHFVEKHQWKNSIRKAVVYYLDNYK